MNALQSLICVSTAARELGPQDMAAMLENSARMNQSDGVHGTLLMSDGNFMQCIEGDVASVERSYARIMASQWHHRVVEMFRSPVARRRFHGWNWALKSGSQCEFSDPDTAHFLETPGHDQPVAWGRRAMEQKILRDFWDTEGHLDRIW